MASRGFFTSQLEKTSYPKISRRLRQICVSIWIGIMIFAVGSFILNPRSFTAENIAVFLQRFGGAIWFIYFLFSAVRGLTLLPSTPLVIAGTLLFPAKPFEVLAVCLFGIYLSSSMIYFFSDLLGFNDYFESRSPELTDKLKVRLEHPLGFLFVALWAFFPFVPTDLVCYVAGTSKMNYVKFILAVLVGETILCTIYVFFGGVIVKNYLR